MSEQEISISDALTFGMQQHQAGRLAEAEHIYRKILEVSPEQVDAKHFLGVVAHQLGRTKEAIVLLEPLAREHRENVDIQNNLGRVYKDAGQIAEARTCFEKAIELDRSRPDLWTNLGAALRADRDLERAGECYRKALELEPSYSDAHLNLGNLLQQMGRDIEAAIVYRRAIDLSPDRSLLYQNLSQALYRAGQKEGAKQTVREWMQLQPNDPGARHLAAALGIVTPPDRASDQYVREHFDEHSASFDEHLRELDYRAPELIGAALERCLPTSDGLRVLDAGCGTGLCAPFLRKRAVQLDGVDLSEGMVAQADGRGDYDRLIVGELTEFLLQVEDPYDVVACADTLCYFGTLDAAIEATRSALKPEGWFLFTVESLDALPAEKGGAALDDGHLLRFHGRYAHSAAYLRTTLAKVGLVVHELVPEVLRTETGRPVDGYLVSAQRPAK